MPLTPFSVHVQAQYESTRGLGLGQGTWIYRTQLKDMVTYDLSTTSTSLSKLVLFLTYSNGSLWRWIHLNRVENMCLHPCQFIVLQTIFIILKIWSNFQSKTMVVLKLLLFLLESKQNTNSSLRSESNTTISNIINMNLLPLWLQRFPLQSY